MPCKPTIPRVCESCGKNFLALSHIVRRGGARFCSQTCSWDAQVGHSPKTLAARLAALTDRSGDCWVWTGATLHTYGMIRVGDHKRRVHRVAWEIAFGPIPDPYLFVCHRCDNRLCVRPEHLFLGTHEDNQRDKVEKGRHIRGMTVPRAKLNDDQVREIRRLSTAGRSRASLGREFGIGAQAVGKIVLRQRWMHI